MCSAKPGTSGSQAVLSPLCTGPEQRDAAPRLGLFALKPCNHVSETQGP